MSKKIAGASALLVFAVCLILGLMADNTMTTILSRSLSAMAVTLFVGLVIGTMAEKMMQEHRTLLQTRRAAEQAAGGAVDQQGAPAAAGAGTENAPARHKTQASGAGAAPAASARRNATPGRAAGDNQKNRRTN